MIDLHVHTTCSDGTNSIDEIFEIAQKKEIEILSITDHDTVSALTKANQLSKEYNIEFINGIEFTTLHKDNEVHMLAYGFDKDNKMLKDMADTIKDLRFNRNMEMIAKFNSIDIPMTYDDLLDGQPNKIITRAHFAKYLYENDFVSGYDEAFAKYLSNGHDTYVPKKSLSSEDIIKNIHLAGGIASLAHPNQYKFCRGKYDEVFKEFKDIGLDGIEGFYNSYDTETTKQFGTLAKKYGFVLTGGSDYHGTIKPNIDLGTGKGNLNISKNMIKPFLDLLSN